ncbi:XdhC family protein [Roseovarius salinarum]|uniref:XdhC family protein n=1 Tax=Roseovarius salinarum TaxID=1981892 RepID=UPI000C322472|nr:XdhC family protein [Roseovarius salinarum]
MPTDPDLDQEIHRLRGQGAAFAVATVVRTMASTAARPGARALVDGDGRILAGFLGGGCVRGAVGRAARAALAEGVTKFLSLRPEDLLAADGVSPGETHEGVEYARNGCPSRGALDIFIEPVLPKPRLLVCGAGPVAMALGRLSEGFDFHRTLAHADGADVPAGAFDAQAGTLMDVGAWPGADFVVVATQGAGDARAMSQAMARDPEYVAFVGSRRKFAALSETLVAQGADPAALARVRSPAGLHIHAITPDEIALSILAQIVAARRSGARDDA